MQGDDKNRIGTFKQKPVKEPPQSYEPQKQVLQPYEFVNNSWVISCTPEPPSFVHSMLSLVMKVEPVEPPIVQLQRKLKIDTLRILSQNVWFDYYKREVRTLALLKLIEERDIHIACLQEMTPLVACLIASSPFIRENYQISCPPQDTKQVSPYGLLMLIKKNIKVKNLYYWTLPSNMFRNVLCAEVVLCNPDAPLSECDDNTFFVSTVHLESLQNTPYRTAQLRHIYKQIVQSATNAMLMGDFNFSPNDPEETVLKQELHQLEDQWAVLKPQDDPGFTWDYKVNTMLKKDHFQDRYDRITVKCNKSKWQPKAIEIVSNKKIASETSEDVFISDHFGLYYEIVKL